jgi:prolyl-tRNA synthetase
MFADMELIGIHHRLVIGDKHLDDGKVEYKGRGDAEMQLIALDQAVAFLTQQLAVA